MRQARVGCVSIPDIATRKKYAINVTTFNNILSNIIDSDGSDVILIRTVFTDNLYRHAGCVYLHGKELRVLNNFQWFFHARTHDVSKYNSPHVYLIWRRNANPICHFYALYQTHTDDFLFLVHATYVKTAPCPSVIDFLLFALSKKPESKIGTTITTFIIPLRWAFLSLIVMVGLGHVVCCHLFAGNMSVVSKIGVAMSICRRQGEIKNECVYVSIFMIEIACFTFDAVNLSGNESCAVLRLSRFQPEDNSCDRH